MPDRWQYRFEASLTELENEHPDWGLVGAVGWKEANSKSIAGHWSDPNQYPVTNTFSDQNSAEVRRLDEQLLVLRSASEIWPDSDLPGIHMIGLDLSKRLAAQGKKTFAINAPTIHKNADATGKLIQKREDSLKIISRESYSFKAGFDVSLSYLHQKYGMDTARIPKNPNLNLNTGQQECLHEPTILLGRGGSGTRLLSNLAEDCEMFIGKKINSTEDCIHMVPAIYRSLLRRLQCTDAWSQGVIATDLRESAAKMPKAAGWPRFWGFSLPECALILPDLHQAFPNARYVYLHRIPEDTVLQLDDMSARLDNEVGRAAVVAAYDHHGRDRHNILDDSELVRMAITTRHQLELIQAHLRLLSLDRWLVLKFEETITNPLKSLSNLARFCDHIAVKQSVTTVVSAMRSKSELSRFPKAEISEVMQVLKPISALFI